MKKQPKNNRKPERGNKDDLKEEVFENENKEEDKKEQVLNVEEEKKEEEPKKNEEVERLKKEVEELKDLNMRLKAEFINFKNRTQREKDSIFEIAKSDCVSSFLEVLDNLERASSLVEKKDKLSEGIDLVVSKFYDVLNKLSVVEIDCLGKVFNPNLHEAIKVIEDEKFDKNVVCEVFQKGFMLNDVVVRHALVVVANP